MSAPAEHWVLCGGAAHARAPADALRLAVSGPAANLKVDVGGISEKLIGEVPPQFKDLLLIASYVLAADSATSRGDRHGADLNRRWHRRFRFVIAVERPQFWSDPAMADLLAHVLGFVSDDIYSFEFRAAQTIVPEQLIFSPPDGRSFVSWDHVDEVVLFSGGLDSLTGAAEQIVGAGKNVILVSHRSATKTWKVQRELVVDLQRLSGAPAPEHVGIEVVKQDAALRTERTQRSRSLLYAAVAGTVAHLVGRDRVLLYENGIIGLNLPISPQVLGANATRTAHPKTLRGFSRILEAVAGRRITVENPFMLNTRPEVLERLQASGAASLIKHTVSCAHVHKSSSMHPHCGVCSQCVDRRFAVIAADLQDHDPAEGYAVDLIRGEWNNCGDRQLLMDYVDSADRFSEYRNTDDFLAGCGEAGRAIPSVMDCLGVDADTAGRSLFEMHKRHGEAIGRVLSRVSAEQAKEMRNGKLPETSMPMLLLSRGLKAVTSANEETLPPNPVLDRGGKHLFRNDGEMWTLRYDGGKAFPMKCHKGLRYLQCLLQRPGETLTAFALVDLGEGRETATRPLATTMGLDAQAVRSVKATLKALTKQKEEAEEFSDEEALAKCEQDMERLVEYLHNGTGPGGRARRETPDQKKARSAVSNAISRAIVKIEDKSPVFAAHLKSQVQSGFFLCYRKCGIAWET